MLVEVLWTELGESDPLWSGRFCLYAYLHPQRDWLLYVGKADYSSVRRRLSGDHKDQLFDDFYREYGVGVQE